MKKLLFVLLFGALIAGCQKKAETVENTSASSEFENERQAFFNNLISPSEAAARLQATAADFNASLLSDPKNYGSYAGNENKAAANLGIYLADLNYCIAYKQEARIKELFPAAHALSKSIGIEQGILDFLMKRYTDNLAQQDSVKAVVDALYASSTRDLQGTEREKLVGIAMAAYQIENLHLALGVLETYPKDILPQDARIQILIPVFRMVLDQKTNVELIYGFLKSISDVTNPDQNPNYPYYASAFEELIAVYQKLDVEGKIKNNQGQELLNDAVVKELSEKVNAIRSKIVSVEN
ncbi:MAG: hypothetical protein JNM57_07775 [Cyclobacteriaceae bacterium]|nr:hypothetical protein [Cyclobacteriaceae bacterium]